MRTVQLKVRQSSLFVVAQQELKLEKRNAKITLLIPKFFNKFLYIFPG